MANFITSAAKHARNELALSNVDVKHGVLLQIAAALMGYETYAALKIEWDDESLSLHLGDAEVLVLNQPMGVSRASELVEEPYEVVSKCMEALERGMTIPVYRSVEAFYSGRGIETVAAVQNNNIGLASNLSSLRQRGGRLIAPEGFSYVEPLWSARTCWTLRVEALWMFESESEGRSLAGLLMSKKAGRAGLIFAGSISCTDWFVSPELVIDCFPLDAYVSWDDGAIKHPWVAIVVHKKSGLVLGSSVSIDGDMYQLMAKAIGSTRNTLILRENDFYVETSDF